MNVATGEDKKIEDLFESTFFRPEYDLGEVCEQIAEEKGVKLESIDPNILCFTDSLEKILPQTKGFFSGIRTYIKDRTNELGEIALTGENQKLLLFYLGNHDNNVEPPTSEVLSIKRKGYFNVHLFHNLSQKWPLYIAFQWNIGTLEGFQSGTLPWTLASIPGLLPVYEAHQSPIVTVDGMKMISIPQFHRYFGAEKYDSALVKQVIDTVLNYG